MQLKNEHLLVIGIIAILAGAYYFGYLSIPGQTVGPNPFNPTPTPVVTPASGKVNVDKTITWVGIDELAGGSLDGTTSAITVYDTDGVTVLETLTFSSGKIATANTYASGKVLWVKYYYDTTIDAYKYWQITVPQMNPQDAESATTQMVTLKTREAGAYSDSLLTSSGLTIADGNGLNTTGTSNDSLTFTYNFFETTDNAGYPSFHDPVYNIDLSNIVWVTLSGTGYETVSLTGFDGSFEKGSTQYYYMYVSDDEVSKQKIGNNYVIPGSGSITFAFSASGFGNTTTSYPTMQVDLVEYSNVDYMKQFGSYGPYHFHGCEQTMLIYDIS